MENANGLLINKTHKKKKRWTHTRMHTHKLVLVLRYLQNRPTVRWDWYRPMMTTVTLPVLNSPPHWEVQRFIYKYQRPELWYLSSDAVPRIKLRKLPPTSAKPCVFVNTHFCILCFHAPPHKRFSVLIYRPRSISEAVCPLWATSFWTEASFEALLPVCSSVSSAPLATTVVSNIILKFLSAQLLMG